MSKYYKPLSEEELNVKMSHYAGVGPLMRPRPEEKDDSRERSSPSEIPEDNKIPPSCDNETRDMIEQLQREVTLWREESNKHLRQYMEAKDFETQTQLIKAELEKQKSANFVLEQHNQSLREDSHRAQLQSEALSREKEREKHDHELGVTKMEREKNDLTEEVASLKQELKDANVLIGQLQNKLSTTQQELDYMTFQMEEIKSSKYAVKKIQHELDRMQLDLDQRYRSQLRLETSKDSIEPKFVSSPRNARDANGFDMKTETRGMRDVGRITSDKLDSYLIDSVVADTVESLRNKLFSPLHK